MNMDETKYSGAAKIPACVGCEDIPSSQHQGMDMVRRETENSAEGPPAQPQPEKSAKACVLHLL